MNAGVLIVLVVVAALAEDRPVSVMGTVESVSGNVVYINTGGQLTGLAVNARTEVWKGKVFHDLSQVEAGDNAVASYRVDASGKLVAESITLNITAFDAVITRVAGAGFEVLTNPNADPQSAYRKENKTVQVDADTTFDASAKEDLQAGRNVHVVGLRLKSGEVSGTRITVYEHDRPVRMRRDAVVIGPNGAVHQALP